MDISYFFSPLSTDIVPKKFTLDHDNISDCTDMHITAFPNWSVADIVIMGCDEDRGARNLRGAALATQLIRQKLYGLAIPKRGLKIADLGNLIKKDTVREYYDGIALAMGELLKAGKIVILIGGTQDITYGQYMAYGELGRNVEYVHIDSRLDVFDSDFGINNESYNHKIFIHSPNYLFNFTNLGFQSYFVPESERERLANLHFQGIRLGQLREDLKEAEPALRNADLVSVDMGSIRSADSPGSGAPSPAGFTTEEICQLMRYSGMSNRVSSLSLSEVVPLKDFNEQSSVLAALMLWYFIEGIQNRRIDEPTDLNALTKYRATLQGGTHEIVFYKNERSERWWMEVPYPDALTKGTGRTMLVPCSEADYTQATHDEVPEKWWLTHYRLK